MAMDVFLKIDGIKGESKDSTHKDEIDVLQWSWGGSQSGSGHVGGGSGAGKVNIQDLSITKYIDSSTTTLFQHMCKGTHIKDATLVIRKAGDKPLEYMKMKMYQVFVTSLSTGGSGGEDRLTEHLTLNFSKFDLDYFVQDDKGAGKQGGVALKYDISLNKAA
jgi:type VI secretion system secreted protein Hcp